MIYLYAFLLSGLVCLIAQIILDNTKLTPGHITSGFTVIGSFLGFIGLYPYLINKCGAGARVLISNFGASLYLGGITGYKESGILGIFTGLLENSGPIIVGAIVFAFLLSIFSKPKN